jgi:rhodanese-related sulfurtransferase
MPTREITEKSTMQEILEAYPAAKQALFERYHIGGCSSCGFAPTDTLEQVLSGKGASDSDVEDAIALIKKSQAVADSLQIEPKDLAKLLKENKVKLIDVRAPAERRLAYIEGDQFATRELDQEIIQTWPKDTAMVLYCHKGDMSLEAVTHLSAQGFTNVKSLKGGIDAWSDQIDPLLPRY